MYRHNLENSINKKLIRIQKMQLKFKAKFETRLAKVEVIDSLWNKIVSQLYMMTRVRTLKFSKKQIAYIYEIINIPVPLKIEMLTLYIQ